MTGVLSHRQALAAYNRVVKHYERDLTPDNGPKLVKDWEKTWDSPQPIIPWAIVWHEGPDNWAINVSHNDVIPADLVFPEPATETVLSLWPVH